MNDVIVQNVEWFHTLTQALQNKKIIRTIEYHSDGQYSKHAIFGIYIIVYWWTSFFAYSGLIFESWYVWCLNL